MTSSERKYTVLNQFDPSENLVHTALPLENQPSIERFSQIGFDPEKLVPAQTYVECGIEKLTALCNAVGLNAQLDRVIQVFRALTTSWGDRRVGETTTWRSDVSDDCAPFEFSLALDPQQTELRVLVEAQGSNPTLQSNWQAGLDLNQYLSANFNVSLDRFEQIADLFAPTNPEAKFSMWHAVCFYPDKEPAFKLYLNPQAQSTSRSAAVIEESLVRLGFTHAWPTLAQTAAQRGPDKDQFVYFALDLAAHERARVKVYLRHQDATPIELESALSAARNYVPGDAIEFCQAMAPDRTSFGHKSVVTCFSLIEGDDAAPSSGTLYLPISSYTENDRVVSECLHKYLSHHILADATYDRALQAFAMRSLNSRGGMHSHVSMRREGAKHRVAVYLNPEINPVFEPERELNLNQEKLRSLEATAWHYELNSIAQHPFLQRLQREPVNLTHLWLLFANGRDGIVADFTRRLASVVGRINNEHICCILTKQLNEELGNGNIAHVHRKLFDRLILALEPHKPKVVTADMSVPGQELSKCLESLYADLNPYVGVGAAIVMEVRGKQIDEVMGKEFVTRTQLDRSALLWLHLHEELEVGHADEAQELARIVNNFDGDAAAARHGAEKTAAALWNFF